MEAANSRVDSGIGFRTAEGREGRGTLLQLTNDLIVFELYSPDALVEPGVKLHNLTVRRAGRPVCTGDAVVRDVLSTTRMRIVTASRPGGWEHLHEIGNGKLTSETRELMRDWDLGHDLKPAFQIAVSNLRSFLYELSQWLAPIDVAVAAASDETREQMICNMAESLYEEVYPRMRQLWDRLEAALYQVSPEQAPAHRNYLQHELHPLTLCCPLVHRTYSKPLGFAGDYEMVNMILRNRMEGPSIYARVVNAFFLRIDVAMGHRNRIDRLTDTLRKEARRVASRSRPFRAWTVGCGPAEEICRFIRRDELAARCEFVLLDFNVETLEYARAQIERAMRESGRRPRVHLVHQSVNELLKEVARGGRGIDPEFDLSYCAGLFDYLSDRVCSRLIALMQCRTVPGGLVVATNVHPRHTSKAVLDELVEWHLILRSENEVQELVPAGMDFAVADLEPAGTNVFLEVRRSDAAQVDAFTSDHRHSTFGSLS